MISLRTVPTFATAHMFCVSCVGLRKLGFLMAVPGKTEIFCVVYNYSGKADLGKGYWNLKRKLGGSHAFSEIIKLQFGKIFHTLLYFHTFQNYCCLIISKKCMVTSNFLFGF